MKKTITDIMDAKNNRPLVCLTAYTYNIAKFIDPYADLILVGDSLGMVLYGMETTIPVTMDMMVMHGAAVCKGADQALIVVDMPFGSYQESPEHALRNAVRLMKETGCSAVKLEGGAEMCHTVSFLVQNGVAVMGHIGLKPQSVNADGGYRIHGSSTKEAAQVMAGAVALDKAGAFAVVVECIDPQLAGYIRKEISIPVIGIGSSSDVDGQILVTEDLTGLTYGHIPSFVSQKSDCGTIIQKSVQDFVSDIHENYVLEKKSAA